jgi:hypothetical protein
LFCFVVTFWTFPTVLWQVFIERARHSPVAVTPASGKRVNPEAAGFTTWQPFER